MHKLEFSHLLRGVLNVNFSPFRTKRTSLGHCEVAAKGLLNHTESTACCVMYLYSQHAQEEPPIHDSPLCVCVCVCVYLIMSMCPFLAAKCRGDVPLGSVVSPFLGSSKAAHMLLDNNNCTTYTRHTHTQNRYALKTYFYYFCQSSSVARHSNLIMGVEVSYPDSAKFTGQIQRGFPCVIHNTRVGLMLQQHLRLQTHIKEIQLRCL